jgi:outer membrane protein assembly factor BamB
MKTKLALTLAALLVSSAAKCQEILMPTFLGNQERNFYGKGPVPEKLEIVWKTALGSGKTKVGKTIKTWSGNGWTGQPVLVRDEGRDYLITGSYDHNLRKIDSETGKVIWKYPYDDVIKATPTLFKTEDDILILCGSRQGFHKSLDDKIVGSYRAISFKTGKEKWILNTERTKSYSRDVDGSALVIDNLVFLGAENGMFYVINPTTTEKRDGLIQPQVLKELKLYDDEDAVSHHGNLCIESSPCLLEDRIYVTAGSGHVYGINKNTWEKEWDFYIGSDLDGSPVVTKDKKLLVTVEKQYIPGRGGIFKLDPSKSPENAVEWFFPTENRKFCSWLGGIIGSPAIKDDLIAFNAIDGNMYVIKDEIDGRGKGPDNKIYSRPKLIFKKNIGSSISTPLFIDDCLITAGYDSRMHIFDKDYNEKLSDLLGNFESTPLVWENKIYIGSRDGWLYCISDKDK